MTSLRSADTSSTAAPARESSTSFLRMNSVAPTSMPRVGWSAMMSTGSEENSRATTTFWMLPPESIFTCCWGDLQRTWYSSTSRSLSLWMAFMLKRGPLLNFFSSNRSEITFSSMLAESAMP